MQKTSTALAHATPRDPSKQHRSASTTPSALGRRTKCKPNRRHRTFFLPKRKYQRKMPQRSRSWREEGGTSHHSQRVATGLLQRTVRKSRTVVPASTVLAGERCVPRCIGDQVPGAASITKPIRLRIHFSFCADLPMTAVGSSVCDGKLRRLRSAD